MQEPSFVAGSVFFTPDLFALDGVDLGTGELWEAVTTLGPPPPTRWAYTEPRMTLGDALIVSRDGFSLVYHDVSDRRMVGTGAWLFPELEAIVDRTEPLPAPNDMIEHTASAWSPTTGTVAFTFGPFYTNRGVAVQCTEEGGGRFLLAFDRAPDPWTYGRTHLIYRENGELLVHLGGLFVIGPTGELLRSVGLPPDSVPRAYTPDCGILYEPLNARGRFVWWDVDTMRPTRRFNMPPDWSSLQVLSDCRPMVNANYAWWVGRSELEYQQLGPPRSWARPLRDGRFVAFLYDSEEVALLSSEGEEIDRFRLEGASDLFRVYWTPDGHLGEIDNGLWEAGLDLAPTHALDTGMNWAHTNSPLPE